MNHVSRTTARFENEPRLPDGADLWIDGRPLKVEVPKPLVFEVEPGDEGEMAAYIRTAIPLMSDALVRTLLACGVDNLQVHAAVIRELATGREYTNYRAVNVVGVVDAVALVGRGALLFRLG